VLRGTPAVLSATRLSATARQCHCDATQRRSASPAKARASPFDSASGHHRKAPSRGRVALSPGSPRREGFPTFEKLVPHRGLFFYPVFWVFRGWNIPPPRRFSYPNFWSEIRALDSVCTERWFESHVLLLFCFVFIYLFCFVFISSLLCMVLFFFVYLFLLFSWSLCCGA